MKKMIVGVIALAMAGAVSAQSVKVAYCQITADLAVTMAEGFNLGLPLANVHNTLDENLKESISEAKTAKQRKELKDHSTETKDLATKVYYQYRHMDKQHIEMLVFSACRAGIM